MHLPRPFAPSVAARHPPMNPYEPPNRPRFSHDVGDERETLNVLAVGFLDLGCSHD